MLQRGVEVPSPYSHETIWIMRDGWEKPLVCTVRDMHPMMNVAGLRWKPWRGKTIGT